MMQHSRVSLWWVLLHFVAASPAMRLGMAGLRTLVKIESLQWNGWMMKKDENRFQTVGPKGLFEAFETYPHCLTAGATFSHGQSISITPSRYIEQATVLFYKHDIAKQALKLRHHETNSLC